MAEKLTEQDLKTIEEIRDFTIRAYPYEHPETHLELLLRALTERERERDQAQKSLTVLRTLMQGERLEVACSQRDALQAQLEQAKAALAKRAYVVESTGTCRLVECENCATARETIRGLREALRKITKRALQDNPDDVEAEVASGRTINDMYVLAKDALAAQPDAPEMCRCGHSLDGYHRTPGAECASEWCRCQTFVAAQPGAGVGEGKRCSGCGGRGRHAFGCPRDFSSPPAPHAGQEGDR